MSELAPCIGYERGWDVGAKVRSVDLEMEFDDGTKKTVQCCIMEDHHDIEYFATHVMAEFRAAIPQLQLVDAELFEYLMKVLKGQSRSKWVKIMNATPAADRTTANFQTKLDELYVSYTGENPRDGLLEALLTGKFMKAKAVAPIKHVERLDEMVAACNELPGTEPQVDERVLKKIIAKNHPAMYTKALFLSGKKLPTIGLAELTQFFQTVFVLESVSGGGNRSTTSNGSPPARGNQKKSRRNNGNRGRGGQNNSSNRATNFNKPRKDDPCPIHGPSHKWGECYDNRYGENYKPAAAKNKTWKNPNSSGKPKPKDQHYADVEMEDAPSNEAMDADPAVEESHVLEKPSPKRGLQLPPDFWG